MKESDPHLTILDHHIMHEGILGHLGMQVPIPGVLIIIHLLHGEGTTQGPFHPKIGGMGKDHILDLRMFQEARVDHLKGAGAAAAAAARVVVGVLKIILCSSMNIKGGGNQEV